MRTLCRFFALLLLCVAFAAAQTPAPAPPPSALSGTFYAGGLSYGPSGLAATGLGAKSLADGTYAFGVLDAVPQTIKPLTITTNFGGGIAQKLPISFKSVTFWVPSSAGVSWAGHDVGWEWSTGGMAHIPVGKAGLSLNPTVRVLKSSVSNNSGYQVIGSLLIGFGK